MFCRRVRGGGGQATPGKLVNIEACSLGWTLTVYNVINLKLQVSGQFQFFFNDFYSSMNIKIFVQSQNFRIASKQLLLNVNNLFSIIYT